MHWVCRSTEVIVGHRFFFFFIGGVTYKKYPSRGVLIEKSPLSGMQMGPKCPQTHKTSILFFILSFFHLFGML